MKAKKKLLILGSAVLTLILSHQNCGRSYTPKEEKIASWAQASPFAFDTNFNRLAYISCSDMGQTQFDDQQFFTFRIAAKGKSGVKISQSFRDYVQTYPYETQYDILINDNNILNNNVSHVLAIRPDPKNLGTSTESKSNPEASVDTNLMDSLDSPRVVDTLFPLSPSERRNTFVDSFGANLSFRGSLSFFSSEEQHKGLRGDFEKGGLLALTYSNDSSDRLSPLGINTDKAGGSYGSAYGIGLSLSFTNGGNASPPKRMLASVSEKNLATNNSQGNWKCDDDMKFVIIPNEAYNSGDIFDDKNGKYWYDGECTNTVETSENKEKLQRVRDLLGDEKLWIVNLDRRCVVPIGTRDQSCYGNLSKETLRNARIDYKGDNKECNDTGASFTNTSEPLCPHYVSICYRTD